MGVDTERTLHGTWYIYISVHDTLNNSQYLLYMLD
jgi:hypothetical protein